MLSRLSRASDVLSQSPVLRKTAALLYHKTYVPAPLFIHGFLSSREGARLASPIITRDNRRNENNLISAFRYRVRGKLACSLPNTSHAFAEKRELHTHTKDTEKDEASLEKKYRMTYRNKHGEEIMFLPNNPPPGYVFVPSGSRFLTRRCRELAPNSYAVFRPKSRKKMATHKGLYVPQDTLRTAESEYNAKRASFEENLSRALGKQYPRMPIVDKNELHEIISSSNPGIVGTAPDYYGIIYSYVRDRYTPFKSCTFLKARKDNEAMDPANQKTREILASWRGEDTSKKS